MISILTDLCPRRTRYVAMGLLLVLLMLFPDLALFIPRTMK